MNKNIVLINDISGVGKCSLMASIPIFSYFEIQPHPIVTAILSNQTEFENFSFFDFTPYIKEYIDIWEMENRKFNCIYSGFLGSLNQINIVKDFVKKHEESIIVIDPVMGDNGKIYSTYTNEMCNEIKELIKHANIITPNLTEAKILTNRPLDLEINYDEGIKILNELSDMGPDIVVLTGVEENGIIKNLCYKKSSNEYFQASGKYYNYSFSGTGDIFTSIFISLILNGIEIDEALKKATDAVIKGIEESIKEEFDTREGIKFEKVLKSINI